MKLSRASSVCSITSESRKIATSRKSSRTSITCCNPKAQALHIVKTPRATNGLGCLKKIQQKTDKALRKEYDNLESCFINIMPTNDYKIKEDVPVKEHVEKAIQPKMIEIRLNDSCVNPFLQRHLKCLYLPKGKQYKNKTRGTQTLYRESSMQTLPYLPDISNDKDTLKTLELFKLPNILKGDGPPGLREVEVLERARKRWALEKTIKEKFQCSMKMARSDFARKRLMTKHKAVLEAFEWENWLEREERIQACQMLRFQLVLRIFHKREQEMYRNSNKRIQLRCEQALNKRNQALKKNEIEFGRTMRRLRIAHEKRPRNWRNEKISIQLGDPSSEYYAPQMRYGVNPNRRHFELSRKSFEMRMEDLEKRAVNMKNLECPFAKLKEWSKPKAQQTEVEQKFCSDANLQKLYENLKGLRQQSMKHKTVPRCLVERTHHKHSVAEEKEASFKDAEEYEQNHKEDQIQDMEQQRQTVEPIEEEKVPMKRTYSHNSVVEMFPQSNDKKLTVADLLDERHHEELEIMLADYEGSTIGWLIRFLSEEMRRLQEQRKLHFLSMLAQKERWRREANEAGLRQKENEMRKIYEEMFNETEKANIDVCEQYLNNIFGIDTQEHADHEAINSVTELAKVIDADLQRWLVSFKSIQNPLNYDDLRCLLRDLVFPEDLSGCLKQKHESGAIVDFIVDDLLDDVIEKIEPFDVCFPLASDFVDRLIDNDLYLFSSECSSDCECYGECECQPPELEAAAIIRKLIRHSVPGRRWRTSTERIADENVKDIIQDICGESQCTRPCVFAPGERRKHSTLTEIFPQLDLRRLSSDEHMMANRYYSGSTSFSTDGKEIRVINYKKPEIVLVDINKRLTLSEEMLWIDSSKMTTSEHLQSIKDLSVFSSRSGMTQPSSLKASKSTYDIMHPEREISINTESSTDDSFVNTKDIDSQQAIQLSPEQIDAALITKEFVGSILNEVLVHIDQINIETDASVTAPELETSVCYTFQSEGAESSANLTESFYADDSADEAYRIAQSKYKMVMYEGELKKILHDGEEDECKCQTEIDYRNQIRSLYENDQIKVIYKARSASQATEQPDDLIEPTEMTFEYNTTTTGIDFESSFQEDGFEEEAHGRVPGDDTDEKAIHRVTFEQTNEDFKVAVEAAAPADSTIANEAEPINHPNEKPVEEVPQQADAEEAANASGAQEGAQPTGNEQPTEEAQQEGTEQDPNTLE